MRLNNVNKIFSRIYVSYKKILLKKKDQLRFVFYLLIVVIMINNLY